MIDKNLIPIGGLKKEPFSGSHHGMRYYMQVDEDKDTFSVTVYPEPWCFESSPEESKEVLTFPLSDEGMDAAVDWLFSMYKEKNHIWQEAEKNIMHLVFQG